MLGAGRALLQRKGCEARALLDGLGLMLILPCLQRRGKDDTAQKRVMLTSGAGIPSFP